MAVFRPIGNTGGFVHPQQPGDFSLEAVSFGPASEVFVDDDVDIPITAFTTKLVLLEGSGGFTARFPSAVDLYNFLTVGGSAADIQKDLGFYVDFWNTSGDSIDITSSSDNSIILGGSYPLAVGKGLQMAFSFTSVQAPTAVAANYVSGSDVIYFNNTNSGMGIPVGPSSSALNISIGAAISPVEPFYTTDAQTVKELIYGTGGIIGIVATNPATETGTAALILNPRVIGYLWRLYDIPTIT